MLDMLMLGEEPFRSYNVPPFVVLGVLEPFDIVLKL